jgi:hypothetical protein
MNRPIYMAIMNLPHLQFEFPIVTSDDRYELSNLKTIVEIVLLREFIFKYELFNLKLTTEFLLSYITKFIQYINIEEKSFDSNNKF